MSNNEDSRLRGAPDVGAMCGTLAGALVMVPLLALGICSCRLDCIGIYSPLAGISGATLLGAGFGWTLRYRWMRHPLAAVLAGLLVPPANGVLCAIPFMVLTMDWTLLLVVGSILYFWWWVLLPLGLVAAFVTRGVFLKRLAALDHRASASIPQGGEKCGDE